MTEPANYLVTQRHRETNEYITKAVKLDASEADDLLAKVQADGRHEAQAAKKARWVDEVPSAFAIAADVVDVELVAA